MAREYEDSVQDVATSTGTGPFVMAGTPPDTMRPFSVHSVGATFEYKAFVGAQYEIGDGTWNGTSIARSPRESSNGGALVNFTTAPTVWEVVTSATMRRFLTAADGVDAATLTNITPTTAHKVLLVDPSTGLMYTALVSALLALYSGAAPAAATAVTMTGPTTGVVSAASNNFTVGVTPVGGTITGTVVVTPSDNGGGGSFNPTSVSLTSASPTATFKYTPSGTAGARTISVTNNGSLSNPANITYTSTSSATPATAITMTGPTSGIVSVASSNFTVALSPNGGTVTGTVTVTPSDSAAGGTFTPATVSLTTAAPSATFTYTPSATAGSKTISITNNGSLSNPASITYAAAAAPAQAITVNNPGTQMVGVTYNASGTYANGTPTALDFSVDGGTNWTAAPSPTIGGGNWSFQSTPSTASASRQMMVRDHTTLVSGTSTAYVVNAAAPTYSTTVLGGFPASQAMAPNGTESFAGTGTVVVSVKTSGGALPPGDALKFVWGKSQTAAPMAYADAAPATGVNGNASAHGNAVSTSIHAGNWSLSTDANYAQYKNSAQFFAWGTPGNWYLWLLTSDGFAKPATDASGSVLVWVLTA